MSETIFIFQKIQNKKGEKIMEKNLDNNKGFMKEIGQIFEFDTRNTFKNPLYRGSGLGAVVMLAFGVENHFYPDKFGCNQAYNNNLYVKGDKVFEFLGETPDPMTFIIREYGKIA